RPVRGPVRRPLTAGRSQLTPEHGRSGRTPPTAEDPERMSTTHSSITPPPTRTSPRPGLSRRPPPPPPVAPPPAPAWVRRVERVKAVAEFPLAAAMLVAAVPVLLLAMLAVRLTSRGPTLYSQTRVGRGGRGF